jgi:hypothetical protein
MGAASNVSLDKKWNQGNPRLPCRLRCETQGAALPFLPLTRRYNEIAGAEHAQLDWAAA